jgi:hypothetical protein
LGNYKGRERGLPKLQKYLGRVVGTAEYCIVPDKKLLRLRLHDNEDDNNDSSETRTMRPSSAQFTCKGRPGLMGDAEDSRDDTCDAKGAVLPADNAVTLTEAAVLTGTAKGPGGRCERGT